MSPAACPACVTARSPSLSALLPLAPAAPVQTVAASSLADLTLKQLATVEVTSASGRRTRVIDAAASV
jgi:hypothetical protein